jgi:hypothetical protein
MGSSKFSKYRRILKSVVLSFLACSQIWLFPLVDDHQSGYITKIEKETLIVRRQHYHTIHRTLKQNSKHRDKKPAAWEKTP